MAPVPQSRRPVPPHRRGLPSENIPEEVTVDSVTYPCVPP